MLEVLEVLNVLDILEMLEKLETFYDKIIVFGYIEIKRFSYYVKIKTKVLFLTYFVYYSKSIKKQQNKQHKK